MENKTYILFPNHTQGVTLEKKLKESKINYIISPTPRSLSICCGIAIMIDDLDLIKVKTILKENPSIEILGMEKAETQKKFFNF